MAGPTFPLWPFRPNWSATVTETLSWLTDVMGSKTGTEQRRSLRLYPRKHIEYTGLHNGRERAMLDNLLTGAGEHDWMLPTWWDLHYPDQDLHAGDQFIPCETVLLGQFRAGGWIVLMLGKFEYEVAQIAGIGANGIALTARLGRDWSSAARIFPLQRARFDGWPQLARRSDDTVLSSFRFGVTEPDALASFPIIIGAGTGLIVNGLLARQYSLTKDSSPYAPESGITVGQAAMMRACFVAREALTTVGTKDSLAAADGYLDIAIALLDGLAGKGDGMGAILRQPLPTSPDDLVLPHWLYAARGSIEGLADQGQGYELFPRPLRIPSGFASAAPEAFRDLDIALQHAALYDARGAAKRQGWAMLRDALMRSNAVGRELNDGRAVLVPWIGLPVIAQAGVEPTGLFVSSGHADARASIELGVNSGGTGYNFLARDTNGDIRIDVPDAFEYGQSEIPKPTSSKPTNDGSPGETTTVTNRVPVLRTTRYGRKFKDIWRGADYTGKADQFLYVSLLLSRELDNGAGEKLFIELTSAGTTYAADFTGTPLTGSGFTRPFLISRDRFVAPGAGALPVGAMIDSFTVCVSAVLAYVLRLGTMRLISGDSEAQAAANLPAAIMGDTPAFSPGVSPFRIAGYVSKDILIGFNGSPWTGAQTPDLWPMMQGRTGNAFSGYTAANVNIALQRDGGIVYPFRGTTVEQGFVKPPEAILAEQNIAFLIQAQDEYHDRTGNPVGPMMLTFLQNRPDRFQFGDNAKPFTWLYNNETTERDIFWQCRSIEACANAARLANSGARKITYEGKQITVNGVPLRTLRNRNDAVMGFDASRGWVDTVTYALFPVMRFIRWFDSTWTYRANVAYQGKIVTVDGANLQQNVTSDDPLVAHPISYVDDPAIDLGLHARSPHAVAVYLRSLLWVRMLETPDYDYVGELMRKCFLYVDRFWHLGDPLDKTWFDNETDMRWWYSEIILTYAEMVRNPDHLPAGIDAALVQRRLTETAEWLEKTGSQVGERVPGLDQTYLGLSVLTTSPNEVGNMTVISERLTEDFDNDVSIPLRSEYDPGVWNRPQYTWWMAGRKEHDTFRKMLYAIRGRAVPFWNLTHSADLILVADVEDATYSIDVENVGYTISGGPRRSRQHVAIKTYTGDIFFREIVGAEEIDGDIERLTLSRPFRGGLEMANVYRISYMDVSRFDQDGIQIAHTSDTEGVSSSTTVFKSVKTV